MGNRKQREPGPQSHAEGEHGDKTRQRFVELLHDSRDGNAEARTEQLPVEGHRRLHQDREQHDEAEKNSEKVEAMKEIQRGQGDEQVRDHARVPHEGDAS